MQVNATLIAAQQAAREAQVRFQATHNIAPKPAASFASALNELGAVPAKPAGVPAPQTTAPQAKNLADQAEPGHTRPGTFLDIRV